MRTRTIGAPACWLAIACFWAGIHATFGVSEPEQPAITFSSLLQEMTNRAALTHWPNPAYRSLQASSYNRSSKTPDDPGTWFANGDCGFALRTETNGARREAVLMEHEGPGVITRIWTPFFYHDFNNRTGTIVRFYLDGESTPRIATNLIALVRGQGLAAPPFGQPTCRAGDLYLPIPFQKSCKITQEEKAFYYIINYRAYAPGASVESFRPEQIEARRELLGQVGRELTQPTDFAGGAAQTLVQEIPGKAVKTLNLPAGPGAIRHLEFRLQSTNDAQALRSTVLEMRFDGQPTVWCPLGDFFSNVNGVDAYRMWEREVRADGTMVCRWIMPYQRQGEIRLHNLAAFPVKASVRAVIAPWKWTPDTFYFHTTWWTAPPKPPRPAWDMNFVEVQGRGLHVGDTLIVLNPLWSWWGEGDEKIYVDSDFDRRFPSHFGTGSEDYYGWAGGEVPTRKDEFSAPFLANVRVGGQSRDWEVGKEPYTHGYNICTRTRSLDATPFSQRFKFDMEAFNMIDTPDAFLQYALVTHWYAAPGATHNRPPMPEAAAAPVPQTEDVAKAARQANAIDASPFRDLIELELVKTVTFSAGMSGGRQDIGNALPPHKWSNGAQFLCAAQRAGESVEFTLSGYSHSKRLILYPTQSKDYGILNIYVNDRLVVERWDGYDVMTHLAKPLDLGIHQPEQGRFRVKAVLAGKNARSENYLVGWDALALEDTEETGVSAIVRDFLGSGVFDERPGKSWPRLIGLSKRSWGVSAVAILWNPGASDQAVTLDFASAGLDPRREYALWSYRDSRFLGFARGSWTTPILPASGSVQVRITELDRSRGLPVLIGSSLHPYCGAAEIQSFQPGRNDLEIELTDAGAPQGELYVHSPFNLAEPSATGCAVRPPERVGDEIWKITISDRQAGQPQHVRLRLILPFLQRPSVWLAAGMALASIVCAIGWSVHRQRAQLAMVRLEQQNTMERERARIARDIHDDLGSNLAEIAMLSELAQEELPPNHPARARLNEIYLRAEKNVRRLGDIVWAVNPGGDTLEQFAAHLCKFAQDYLAAARVRCRLDLSPALPPVTLDSVQRHNLFSAAKEAIHNAVQHGAPSELVLRLALREGRLIVSIEDNGRGFDDAAPAPVPHGSANMRSRMEQIGGQFARRSRPGHGTRVTLSLPLATPAVCA
jgi:signal transduction histidine kinase